MENEKTNTFQEMEDNKQADTNKHKNSYVGVDTTANSEVGDLINAPGEVDLNAFSDVAIGDKVKYVRPDLDGKEDVIDKFQVFTPDTTKEPTDSQAKTSQYWPITMILTYESKNEEDVQNKEYISGAKVFKNKDGSPSDMNFWYEGSGTQSAYLWELVAKANKVNPKDMSPRQFVAYLSTKPKVKIIGQETKNYGAPAGSPKFISKNMPGSFI